MPAQTNEILADYEILRVLGSGSHGMVYLVREKEGEQLYAAKEFLGGKASAQRFFRELSILFTLRHPHIIRCENLLCGAQKPHFLLLEYVEGGTLAERLEANPGGLPPDEVLLIAQQLASALAAAHACHIIHCDLKPANILFATPGSAVCCKLADLGVAFHLRRDGQGTSTGTPLYMAPEQFFDTPSPQSDLYSLGVVLFECLAGIPPFAGGPEQLFALHSEAQPDLAKLPAGVWQSLIGCLLAKSPAHRPKDAASFLAELDALAEGTVSPSLQKGTSTPRFLPAFPPDLSPTRSLRLPMAEQLFATPAAAGNDLWIADAQGVEVLDISRSATPRRLPWTGRLGAVVTSDAGGTFFAIAKKIHRLMASGRLEPIAELPTEARAFAISPDETWGVSADSRSIYFLALPGSAPKWKAPCPNYHLRPKLSLLPQGLIAASTGPANPALQLWDVSGTRVAEIALDGPLLAIGDPIQLGDDASLIVQTFGTNASAKLQRLVAGRLITVRDLIPGVFHAEWHGSFFTLFTVASRVFFLPTDGSPLAELVVTGNPLCDACLTLGTYQYALLLEQSGVPHLHLFDLQPANSPQSPFPHANILPNHNLPTRH